MDVRTFQHTNLLIDSSDTHGLHFVLVRPAEFFFWNHLCSNSLPMEIEVYKKHQPIWQVGVSGSEVYCAEVGNS